MAEERESSGALDPRFQYQPFVTAVQALSCFDAELPDIRLVSNERAGLDGSVDIAKSNELVGIVAGYV